MAQVLSNGSFNKPSWETKRVTITLVPGNSPVFQINNHDEWEVKSYGKRKNKNRISLKLALRGSPDSAATFWWFSCKKRPSKEWNPHCAEMLEVARNTFPVLKDNEEFAKDI